MAKFIIDFFTEKDEVFKNSQIIVADFDLLSSFLYELPNAKWIQGTWAGVETLLKHVIPNQPPSFLVTRFSGKYFGTLMGEYVIANIINHERKLFDVRENQMNSNWIITGNISEHRTIPELNIGILGLGSIGNRSMCRF